MLNMNDASINNTKLDIYEQLIEAYASYKRDFLKMKVQGDFWPALIFVLVGSLFVCYTLLTPNKVLGMVMLLPGTIFLFIGFFIRNAVQATKCYRVQLFDKIWDSGTDEWQAMIIYLGSHHAAASAGLFKISDGTIAGFIGSLAFGQFLGYVGSSNHLLNSKITGCLLVTWALSFECLLLKKSLFPNRMNIIELVLKDARKYHKKKKHTEHENQPDAE